MLRFSTRLLRPSNSIWRGRQAENKIVDRHTGNVQPRGIVVLTRAPARVDLICLNKIRVNTLP